MSAEIKMLPPTRKFRYMAWCEECQDGTQGGKVAITNWAYLHNVNHHEGDDA